ncbi:MAG: ROK family protein [Solobacterium sp.]|nr:ROK family protein [Solobacterium sp.]
MKKYLAVDLGGTAIKYGVADEKMNFLVKGKVDARTASYEDFRDDLKKILEECGEGVEGMAISMPGMIDRIKGFAYSGGAYRWVKQIPLAMKLKEELGLPVTICNDAKAAALAELGFGNLQDIRNGIAIILGTGIGGAIIIEGKLLDGSHYSSGEFSFIQENKREKGKCMDIFAFSNGVMGLKNAIKEASGLEDIDGLKAFRLIKEENNEAVLQGVKDFCWYLAYHIYNLQCVIDANRVVIGGGISNEPMFIELVKEAVTERFAQAVIPGIPQPEIMVCRYQSDANLVGAIFNFMQMVEGRDF